MNEYTKQEKCEYEWELEGKMKIYYDTKRMRIFLCDFFLFSRRRTKAFSPIAFGDKMHTKHVIKGGEQTKK